MPRTANTTVLAGNTVQAHPLDSETYGLDLTDKLPTGVTASSATVSQKTAAGAASTDLTLGSPSVNTATFPGVGRTVAIGKGVLFTATGGTAGEDYLLTVAATCSDSKVRHVVCRLEVRDGTESA